ncbi:MAG TPA: hypothetical protein VFN31_02605 [Candidatus Saccharimonadales bacterium]|nr:hypothetical protein [Candidatus Saccharimonadales bacterium]
MKNDVNPKIDIPELHLPAGHPERLGSQTDTQLLFMRARSRNHLIALQLLGEASALAPNDLVARSIILSEWLLNEEVAIRTEQIDYLADHLAA